MPVGPTILWPVNATRSAPSDTTSTGSCGTACDASSTTVAPTAWPRAAISATGLTVPSTFDTYATEMILVRSLISPSAAAASRSSRPSAVTSNQRSTAPVRSASSCQGTMLEWCSITEMTISSPARRPAPSVWAHRLRASDAFLVKTISSERLAPTNWAIVARAPSNASVASAPSRCMARATLALWLR